LGLDLSHRSPPGWSASSARSASGPTERQASGPNAGTTSSSADAAWSQAVARGERWLRRGRPADGRGRGREFVGVDFMGWALLSRSGLDLGLVEPDLGTLMRHSLSSPPPVFTLACGVLAPPARACLIAAPRLSTTPAAGRRAAAGTAVPVSAVAAPADHDQSRTLGAAELPCIRPCCWPCGSPCDDVRGSSTRI